MTLPDRFPETRDALHAVAEHVLAAARYQAAGRIGLEVTEGGFATPPFGDDGRVLAVIGTELVAGDGGRAPLTTLRAAGELAGITPGAPADVYTPATPLDLDTPLAVDDEAARRLAAWFALGDAALRELTVAIAGDDPSPITLWPEHFDLGTRAAGVNYGVSPGDEQVEAPYLYVGPDAPDPADEFWNQSFGATATWNEIRSVPDAVAFFTEGRRHALGPA
jgi:hypothetical protein